MQIYQIAIAQSFDNYNYIIADKKAVVVVDPWDGKQIFQWCENNQLAPTHIAQTHSHSDHTRGVEYLREKKVEFVGEKLFLNDFTFIETISTPGHTNDHVSFLIYENNEKVGVLSGDTVFNAGVGNCKSGDPKKLYRTLKNIYYPLPDTCKVYPGHDYLKKNLNFTLSLETDNYKAQELLDNTPQNFISTIGIEKDINLFFRLNNPSLRKRLKMQNASEEEVFLKLRKHRDQF
ncbi:MAG: hydroxyacylglutathione hydrolase C-terminal domain-containing protein [bacterium]